MRVKKGIGRGLLYLDRHTHSKFLMHCWERSDKCVRISAQAKHFCVTGVCRPGAFFKSRRKGAARLNKHCKMVCGPDPVRLRGARQDYGYRSPTEIPMLTWELAAKRREELESAS